jgi:monomeric isocitrate dehydrogenase
MLSNRQKILEKKRDAILDELYENTNSSPQVFSEIHNRLSHVLLDLYSIKQKQSKQPRGVALRYETSIYTLPNF